MHAADVRALFTHMEWADALAWRAVRGLPDAPADPRLMGRLHHLHTVQWVYLQAWRGDPIAVRDLAGFADLAALLSWARPYYPQVHALARALDDGAVSARATFPWAAEIVKRYGSADPVTMGESILQVVLHSTYHRAQIATRIRELGADPPLTDWIAWAWMGRPQPEWEG